MKVIHVVGARPNFMKIAPLLREMGKYPKDFDSLLVHTGQHYDDNMSQVFFDDLELPKPDIYLGVGSGTHATQTAQIMTDFETVLLDRKPDLVIVVGDVNSTLACSLTAAKLGVPIAHVEAGLRSFDRTMPEEINRVVTDHLSDWLFITEPSALENLLKEGISREKIHLAGNTMIDTLVRLIPKTKDRWKSLATEIFGNADSSPDPFVLVTLHRPSNVDDPARLAEIFRALKDLAGQTNVVFPIHPRTRSKLPAQEEGASGNHLQLLEPLGYLDFLTLMSRAGLVITDSGGIQEETTYLGVPCLTIRPNTERPVTITAGTNRLFQGNGEKLVSTALELLGTSRKDSGAKAPEFWDGCTAQRIVAVLRSGPGTSRSAARESA